MRYSRINIGVAAVISAIITDCGQQGLLEIAGLGRKQEAKHV